MKRVDFVIEKQVHEKKRYWYEVLRRVVAVLTLLAERGLALRGENEIIGSQNNGNFLGCMELIAVFDPFLARHIEQFGNEGRGTPSYLSSTIFEEFVETMAQKSGAPLQVKFKRLDISPFLWILRPT